MTELQQNLQDILKEKEEKILPENIKNGVTIFGVEGTLTGEGGVDTSDATATAEDILTGKTAYANGEKLIGTMPENLNNAFHLPFPLIKKRYRKYITRYIQIIIPM